MKKVLFVATVVKLHIMVFHIPYLEWFKKNGYEVHVAAKNDYSNMEDCKIPYCDKFYDIPFDRSPIKKNNINSYKNLKKIIDTNEYEIIHCHTPVGGAITRLAAKESRKNGTKVIYTAHGFHFFKGSSIANWLFFYPIERHLSKFTDDLITINKEDFFLAKKFPKSNIHHLPGVGINIDEIKDTTKVNIREELLLSPEDIILLSVGEINNNKNHEVVIQALAECSKVNIHYVICGEGAQKEYLIELSNRLKLKNNVHFLGFRNDVTGIYKDCDLFIFPSYREGLSVSLMEAMANGLPVIASEIRGNSDLIFHNKGGYLFKPSDSKQLSHYIKNLVNNREKRYSFGKFNSRVVEDYSIKNVIKEIEKVYKNDSNNK